MKASLDLSKIKVKARGCYAAMQKDSNGERTNRPLVDTSTGKRRWWVSLVLFPQNSTGGDDVSMVCSVASDEQPIVVPRDGSLPVTLVNPHAIFTERGLRLGIDGVKLAAEGKATR